MLFWILTPIVLMVFFIPSSLPIVVSSNLRVRFKIILIQGHTPGPSITRSVSCNEIFGICTELYVQELRS